MLLRIFCILMLLYSTAFGKVNGSLGVLMEQGPRSLNLAGIFVEVNSQKYGGYISFTGMSEEEFTNQFRTFSHVNLGVTYFIKKKLGFMLHGGVFEDMYQKLGVPRYSFYKNKPGDKLADEGYPNLIDWGSTSYFSYGGGLIFYTLDKNVVLHLKVSFIPGCRNTFVGLGVGIHLGGK